MTIIHVKTCQHPKIRHGLRNESINLILVFLLFKCMNSASLLKGSKTVLGKAEHTVPITQTAFLLTVVFSRCCRFFPSLIANREQVPSPPHCCLCYSHPQIKQQAATEGRDHPPQVGTALHTTLPLAESHASTRPCSSLPPPASNTPTPGWLQLCSLLVITHCLTPHSGGLKTFLSFCEISGVGSQGNVFHQAQRKQCLCWWVVKTGCL